MTNDIYDVIYEGFFLRTDEIEKALENIRPKGFKGYPLKPSEYHVTTEYKPAVTHDHLYGSKVVITAYAYKCDNTLVNKRGEHASNEGFAVTISSDNAELQKLLEEIEPKNWHITCSFLNEGDAVCTGSIDFKKGATPCCFQFEAIFDGFKIYK